MPSLQEWNAAIDNATRTLRLAPPPIGFDVTDGLIFADPTTLRRHGGVMLRYESERFAALTRVEPLRFASEPAR